MSPPPSAIANADRTGDGDDRPHRRLETARDTGEHRSRRTTGRRRLGDLLHGLGLGRGEVLGDARRDLREHETADDRAEHAPADVRDRAALRVADVDEREHERADDREDAGGEEAAVDRRHRRLVLVGRRAPRTRRRSTRARRWRGRASGKSAPAAHSCGLVREDRLERGNAEDDRRDERDLVRLEQVGRHTGAVTDVVTDVVGDRGRVARVVFGDTGFDLADEVGADVGRLGEDAAADPQEQREQRATEPEADEDRRARVLEDHDDRRAPSRPRPTVNMPATPPVRNATWSAAGIEPLLGRGRGAHVAAHREAHADEAGEARQEATEDERARAEHARLRERQRDVTRHVRERVGLHLRSR